MQIDSFKEPIQVTRWKQFVFAIAGGLLVFTFLGVIKFFQISAAIAAGAEMGEPISAVTTFVVREDTWNREVEAVGSLRAREGSLLSFQESGEVREILVQSGSEVSKGQELIVLDSSIERAEITGARAELEIAEVDLARAKTLGASRVISNSELDAAEVRAREARSRVRSLEARITQKTLTAPFDGQAGIRRVNIGDYVEPGAPVVPLYQLDPLLIGFSLPQQLASSIKTGQRVIVRPEADSERTFDGVITAIDPQIEPRTRTFEVEVEVANTERLLRPGMFVHVTTVTEEARSVTIIPIAAVQFAPYGDSIFQIIRTANEEPIVTGKDYDEALTVKPLFVKLGEKRGDFVEVLSGLAGDEVIVAAGTFRIRAGSPVQINDSVQPQLSTNPQPANR
jgi:membrane fusion protein (multidrug efflux system)